LERSTSLAGDPILQRCLDLARVADGILEARHALVGLIADHQSDALLGMARQGAEAEQQAGPSEGGK
jgi:hypothetical protein